MGILGIMGIMGERWDNFCPHGDGKASLQVTIVYQSLYLEPSRAVRPDLV